MLFHKGRLLAGLCALLAAAPAIFAQSSVRINEVLTENNSFQAGDGSITDWIELINTSGTTVSLAGASLSDDELIPNKWTFPPGVSIPGNGTLVVACDLDRTPSFAAAPYLNAGFNLSGKGGGVFFYSSANPQVLIDSVRYGVQAGDLSIGRVNGIWTLCNPTLGGANAATTLGSQSSLRVNEWLANTQDDDWFEIFNSGSLPISLEGLFFTDKLAEKTKWPVPALSFIGTGSEAFVQFIADGNTENGPDHAGFSFSKDGEDVGIYNGAGALLHSVSFGAQAAEKSEGFLPDGGAVRTVFDTTVSPGEPNYKDLTSIIISEILTHTDPPLEDAVEFYNTTDSPIDIGGWYLSNKKSDLRRYRIPSPTIVPAKSYKVLYENAFNFNNPGTPFNFNSAQGDQVYLAQTDSQGQLTGFRAGEDFEAAENGVSFGRLETSVLGVHQFVALSRRTFGADDAQTVEAFRLGAGATNSGPKVGPIVINEVMYHPISRDGSDNRLEEFIELHNITANEVLLYDPAHPENTWRLQNGVNFSFPPNQKISPLGYALVVSFDPSDAVMRSLFLSAYSLPSSTAVYGPFRGDLNNGGDSIELNKPDAPEPVGQPDAGFVPYIRVDKVNYTDVAPWPTTPDGGGSSLQRKNSARFGNDYLNWQGAAATPANGNSPEVRDSDGDGAPDVWETANQFNPNNSADGAEDFDGDGFTNLQEYIAGTNPRAAGSSLKVATVVPSNGTSPTRITFTAAANKSYSVLFRSNLSVSSSWQRLQNVEPDVNERTVSVNDTDIPAKSARFYQIVTPAID